MQVRANGLIVFIPKFGIEGVVHLTPKEDKNAPSPPAYKLDEERQTVTSADGALAFTVFDNVQQEEAWQVLCKLSYTWSVLLLAQPCVLLTGLHAWFQSCRLCPVGALLTGRL